MEGDGDGWVVLGRLWGGWAGDVEVMVMVEGLGPEIVFDAVDRVLCTGDEYA